MNEEKGRKSLEEFENYKNEFESIPKFDSEVCSVCGITLSDNNSINQIPRIELQFENELAAGEAINKLDQHGIKSKLSSEQKTKILIAEKNLEKAKEILNN